MELNLHTLFKLACLYITFISSVEAACTSYEIQGKALNNNAKKVLLDVMKTAEVCTATVTSTYRTVPKQASVMYSYIQKQGVNAAYSLYGKEGDLAIKSYEQAVSKGFSKTDVINAMTKTIESVIDDAHQNFRLMHVNNSFYVFDVGMNSIAKNKHTAFESASNQHQSIHRFLGKNNKEKAAFHFEIKK